MCVLGGGGGTHMGEGGGLVSGLYQGQSFLQKFHSASHNPLRTPNNDELACSKNSIFQYI